MSKIVKRTLRIFELFASAREPLSLSEISRALGLPVSSCHDVLKTLEDKGYIYQLGPRSGYYPTRRLSQLAENIACNDPILNRAEIEMRHLRERYDCSCFLARIEGQTARYLLVVEAQGPWRYHIETGNEIRSLFATSAGKAVLGSLPSEERETLIEKLDIVALTPNTVRSRDVLREEIEASMARGWYVNHEESVLTWTTLSTVLQWSGTGFVLTLAGPALEVKPRLDEIAETLMAVACRLESP